MRVESQVLTVDRALEEADRWIDLIPRLPVDEQDRLVMALKKETDRLIQVDIDRCRALAGLIGRLAEHTGSGSQRALGLLAEANACSIGLGQYSEAVTMYDQAAQLFESLGNPVEKAKALIGKLYALGNLGRYEEALADGEWGIAVLREHQEWYHLARLKVNMAIVYGRMGKDEQALEMFDRARAVYASLGVEGELSLLRVEMNRAHVLRSLGRFDESIETCQRLYEAHTRLGRRLDAARAQQALALTYFVLGRYTEALALLDTARGVLLEDGRKRHAMLVELFMSDCLLQLRRFPDVLEKCRHVRELFSDLGTRFEVGQAVLNEAAAFAGLRDYARSRASLAEARGLFEQEGNQVAVAETDLQTALVLLESGQSFEAIELAHAAMNAFEQHHLPLWQARAALAAARAALSVPEELTLAVADAAASLIDAALEIGQTHNLPAVTFAGYHLRGQLALRGGRKEAGLADFDRAIEDLEQLCGRMMVEFRAGFVEDKQRLYEDIVSLCLELGQSERGLTYTERAKSRALLEMIAYRLDLSITPRSEDDRPLVEELIHLRSERDRLYRRWESGGGDGVGLRGATAQMLEEDRETSMQITKIENRITGLWHTLLIRSTDYARDAGLWQVRTEPVQPYLDEDTCLVEYFSVHDELVAFVVRRGAVQAVPLGSAPSTIQGLLQLLRLNLHSVQAGLRQGEGNPSGAAGGRAGNARGLLQRLHQLLFAPLEDRLAGERLVIVPHGPLHYLPFQALFDGQRYLVERYEISYLPGSSLLRYIQEPRWPDGPGSLLAVGSSYQGRLPFTIEEARMVAGLWGGDALVEDAASLAAFRQAAPDYRILHLAAHGEFRADNPLFSGLALADGWLTTLDIFNLRLNADLVILSACQTGRSLVGGGDELFGLMRAFLAAGVASLVATFWTVEDQATARFMRHFYERLALGERKGAALRQAQLEFLQPGGDETLRHPYFWAPFFLSGNFK